MKDNEIQQLVDVRAFLINKYKGLDGGSNISSSVMLQKDVAYLIEQTVKRIDAILSEYVKIK